MSWDDGIGEELPCPSCGEPVYEDTDVCRHCGDFITPGRLPAGGERAAVDVRRRGRWGSGGTILALLLA